MIKVSSFCLKNFPDVVNKFLDTFDKFIKFLFIPGCWLRGFFTIGIGLPF
jgi:hypothetical protein